MEFKLDILLVDNSGNTIQELNIKKPETYQELLNIIQTKMKLPEYYNMYYQNEKEKIIINNHETYKLAKDILFIYENNDFNKSIFSLNYGQLSAKDKEILDEKYNCIICKEKIKNNKQLMCYQCQNIYHKKCLEDWENRCKLNNKNFSCPKCKYELSLIKWKAKVNYEDEKNNEANMLVELNKNKKKQNIDNNMYDNYKDKYNILKNEYYKYIENTSNLLKNIFHKSIGIIALINTDNIKKDIRVFNNINEIYANILNNFKIIENFVGHQINNKKSKNEKNINKINITNNVPIFAQPSGNWGKGIKSFDTTNYNQQKANDCDNTTLNNNIVMTNLRSNDSYEIPTNIINANNSQFRLGGKTKIKDNNIISAYNITSTKDNVDNITYSSNPVEYNNNPHSTTTTTTTTITYTTKVLKPNDYEINPTYKDSTINDNATDIIYFDEPVIFNNNPSYTTTTTTTIIRPFTTTTTKNLQSNVNVTNPTYKVSPDSSDDAVDVTYSPNSIENHNNHHSRTKSTKILKPFTTTTTKILKSDFNVINPTYNDSPDVPDNAVDVTYSSNSDSIERNNNQHTSTTTTTTLRPYEIANTKFPMF